MRGKADYGYERVNWIIPVTVRLLGHRRGGGGGGGGRSKRVVMVSAGNRAQGSVTGLDG